MRDEKRSIQIGVSFYHLRSGFRFNITVLSNPAVSVFFFTFAFTGEHFGIFSSTVEKLEFCQVCYLRGIWEVCVFKEFN